LSTSSFRSMLRPPPASTLFPYTTLFRSGAFTLQHPTLRPPQHVVILLNWNIRADGCQIGLPMANIHPIYGAFPEFLHHLFGRKLDRKSTRLNSSHVKISYAVFCLKKKTT